ncbi:Wzz/FepE/Etk N-terminal domain-containing protein [Xanthobacter sp. AM11]|uniref:Wzz/FepE/Etk N-terminal domain-containing protein n=1 Tax=Xanthobacter sp. AM11 TaxID=3380643 RepID=UPI0039BF115C
MLQVDKPIVDNAFKLPVDADLSLQALLQTVRRQKWIIAGVVGLCVGLAALYSFLTTPQYTAMAELLIDTQQNRGIELGADPSGMLSDGMVDSQVQILQSERIALNVIKELKLVEQAKTEKEESGIVSRVLGFIFPFLFRPAEPSDFELERSLVGAFEDALSVKRVGRSFVIRIDYRSPNAKLAAETANQVAESYIVDQLEAKYQATRRASVWLQDRINELRDQALAADRAVQEFKAKNDIIDTARGLVSEQQLVELNTQLANSRATVAEAQARYDRVASIIKEGILAGTSDEVVSDVLNNEVISRLRTQYLDAVKREAEWSKRYGADHIAVVNLRSEIKGLQRALFNELSRIAETYKSDLEIAKARMESMSSSFDNLITQAKTTSRAQVDLRELESTSQSYRALYDNFLQRFMQATQQQSFPITEARVITDATQPLRASHPKKSLLIGGSLFIGLFLGMCLAYLRENMNRTFRVPDDIERYLGSDCLGVLPMIPVGGANIATPGQSALVSNSGIMRQAVSDPFSRFAETLRSVKVTADVSILRNGAKVIGVISTLPKEGKSTVSANLAQLIAHSGQRCVLIDCDLRNPSLSRRLAPEAKVGIIELVLGHATFEEVAIIDPLTKLTVIPAVVPSEIAHTSEILASEKMSELFAKLKASTDYLIVDLPPLAPVVDVFASTHLIDGYVYIIGWNATNRDIIVNTLQGAPNVYTKLLGCVLNKVDVRSMRHLEGYGKQYYYHRYYATYGQD